MYAVTVTKPFHRSAATAKRNRKPNASYCVTFAESETYCHSILFVCLDVCRSFRDLQPTTIDRSQPNLVGRYIPVLGPV